MYIANLKVFGCKSKDLHNWLIPTNQNKTGLNAYNESVYKGKLHMSRPSAGNGAVDSGVIMWPQVNRVSGRALIYLCTADVQN